MFLLECLHCVVFTAMKRSRSFALWLEDPFTSDDEGPTSTTPKFGRSQSFCVLADNSMGAVFPADVTPSARNVAPTATADTATADVAIAVQETQVDETQVSRIASTDKNAARHPLALPAALDTPCVKLPPAVPLPFLESGQFERIARHDTKRFEAIRWDYFSPKADWPVVARNCWTILDHFPYNYCGAAGDPCWRWYHCEQHTATGMQAHFFNCHETMWVMTQTDGRLMRALEESVIDVGKALKGSAIRNSATYRAGPVRDGKCYFLYICTARWI